ncbi:flavin monoamine oxidase family protein [Granulicella sibirica]|uniref:Tryptophan 2-monooxygenase n=1 Tax=Granulicella sibirica TaxID=2479048 RepID=A0A4V1L6D0_9BACT|nr:NAD(P)/FAD-dependent oxidoreductase [Granulicella sibirica]RXH58834.1 amine oxidase [Granulicella sibirica]
MDVFDVVVVGAGMAGLTAARALLERGLTVCVVEAQDRVGGRVLTRRLGDTVVELGAEFVHGRPTELWALIQEAGVTAVERDGAMMESEGDGVLSESDEEGGFSILDELEDYKGPDCGFLEYIERMDVDEEDQLMLIRYVEGFNAADARDASVIALGLQQKAEDAISGDRMWHVREGYARLPEYLAERAAALGGAVRLGMPVEEIRWERGAVAVQCASAETIKGKRVVVTLPLGVLQAGVVRFIPEPEDRLEIATRMRMGQVVRFTLVFRGAFWHGLKPQPQMQTMSFLFSLDEVPGVWWTPHPEGEATLTGWVGGPRSDALAALTAEEIGEQACETLARIFGLQADDVLAGLVACEPHDWRSDPWTLGAYSYIPAGEIDSPRALGVPVEETLYFAGEHTDVTGHWGTVHAAMRSGLRAAEQILGEISALG